MTSIDPTIKQKLINRLSNDYADVEPLTTKKFEQDHFDYDDAWLCLDSVSSPTFFMDSKTKPCFMGKHKYDASAHFYWTYSGWND